MRSGGTREQTQERWRGLSNEKNLIPFSERTESEQREISTAGGIASGVARRRKRALKDAVDLFLSLPVSDKRVWNKLSRKGVDPEDIDNQMAMICGLHARASLGDAKAAKILVDLLGEQAREDPVEDQIAEDAASDMAITLTGLTGDVASFYNISQDAAATKLKSVFTGETESLKELGVVMTQANLEQYALSKGISKSISAMTQAELATLRYAASAVVRFVAHQYV